MIGRGEMLTSCRHIHPHIRHWGWCCPHLSARSCYQKPHAGSRTWPARSLTRVEHRGLVRTLEISILGEMGAGLVYIWILSGNGVKTPLCMPIKKYINTFESNSIISVIDIRRGKWDAISGSSPWTCDTGLAMVGGGGGANCCNNQVCPDQSVVSRDCSIAWSSLVQVFLFLSPWASHQSWVVFIASHRLALQILGQRR